MRTILLLAYAVSPTKGSEYAVAWNFITQMSKSNRLLVLYGKSDRAMGNFKEMDEFLKTNTLENVTFIPVYGDVNKGKEGILYSSFIKTTLSDFFSYKEWHKKAYEVACEVLQKEKVDVVHFLCPIGFKEAGYLWKLDKPYIWGPVAGAHPRPFPLFKVLSMKECVIALGRNIIHPAMLCLLPQVRKAIKRTDVLLSATPLTQKQMLKLHHKNSYYLPENGILEIENSIPVSYSGDVPLKLIWVGTLCPRKGLSILLNALSLLDEKLSWSLDVIGEGDLREELHREATEKKLQNKIKWHDAMSRQDVQHYFLQSHLHIITSLGEATTTVLFEAMAKGIPTLALDHCGMAGVITERAGIKIKINTYDQVINDIAANIQFLIEHPDRINQLSAETIKSAKTYLWSERSKFLNQKIEEAIETFHDEKKNSYA